MMAHQQVLEGRYIDRKRLLNYLNQRFGPNYSVRVGVTRHLHDSHKLTLEQIQLNRWILTIPALLTDVSTLRGLPRQIAARISNSIQDEIDHCSMAS